MIKLKERKIFKGVRLFKSDVDYIEANLINDEVDFSCIVRTEVRNLVNRHKNKNKTFK